MNNRFYSLSLIILITVSNSAHGMLQQAFKSATKVSRTGLRKTATNEAEKATEEAAKTVRAPKTNSLEVFAQEIKTYNTSLRRKVLRKNLTIGALLAIIADQQFNGSKTIAYISNGASELYNLAHNLDPIYVPTQKKPTEKPEIVEKTGASTQTTPETKANPETPASTPKPTPDTSSTTSIQDGLASVGAFVAEASTSSPRVPK